MRIAASVPMRTRGGRSSGSRPSLRATSRAVMSGLRATGMVRDLVPLLLEEGHPVAERHGVLPAVHPGRLLEALDARGAEQIGDLPVGQLREERGEEPAARLA